MKNLPPIGHKVRARCLDGEIRTVYLRKKDTNSCLTFFFGDRKDNYYFEEDVTKYRINIDFILSWKPYYREIYVLKI